MMTDKSNPQQPQDNNSKESEAKAAKSPKEKVKTTRLKFKEEDMIKIKYDF